ncbi:MAG: type II toxin-antitoxin system VapC family toxin [Candidatus Aenigmarchaeota archaeon]|nr:type II toxin-antitoxin system VapC family toxin [Candidatus Aenigmarchaeota archaeon]
MTCLDTDFLVSLMRGDENSTQRLTKLEERRELLTTTSINVAELLKGAYSSENPKKEMLKVDMYLDALEILDFDYESAEIFSKIWNRLKKKGDIIPDFDILIASIAIENNEILLTKNIKHFKKIKELKLESI